MKYYAVINGQQVGPVEEHQLQGMGVTRETLVWHEGMPQWQPAGNLPELGYLFKGMPNPGFGGTTPPGYNTPNYGGNPNFGNVWGPMPKTYLTEAILVTLFCCVPFGIISIINAAHVSSAYNAGNYAEAEARSQSARKWALWALIGGIVSYVVSVMAVL